MRVLAQEEGELALRIARGALDAHLAGVAYRLPPVPPVFSEKRGVFVTLTERGMLRGCIGLPLPVLPLGEALVEAAVSAGTGDPRFPPVSREEMKGIHVEVTILSVPEPMTCPPAERPQHVEVGRHGLIMRGRGRSGLLLPQVATEYGWTAGEFLEHTCGKSGLPPGCWKSPDVEVQTFEGQIFSEPETG
ncbi:MAG: TIGR00296 family protein [Methanomicrobiales archaeon]|nr:TIGR00296 family protein [Methanomicrobiales archaeon]